MPAEPITITRLDPRNVRRILNVLPSPDPERDWGFLNAVSAGIAALLDEQSIPDPIDLRADWYPIANQGVSGSCVGWAVADSLLRWHFIRAGKLGENERLSPRFIWMAAKETDAYKLRPTTFLEDAPTSVKAALDIARKYGAVKEAVLPFDQPTVSQIDSDSFYALAAQFKIAAYFNLGLDFTFWKLWLWKHGPIAIRMVMDDHWWEADAADPVLERYKEKSAAGGHACALVGFEKNRFIARNSWGEQWGAGGYAYVTEGYARAAFKEAYGVVV